MASTKSAQKLNKEKDAEKRPLRTVDMLPKLSAMDDAGLNNLLANAHRLAASDVEAQRKAVAALLPALEAEIAARKVAKLERIRQNAAEKKRTKRKEADDAAAVVAAAKADSET